MAGEFALFQALVANTQLSAAAYADASGKHGRVRQCLNTRYYGVSSPSANSRLVGSYGKDTETRPPSDVDILFELPYDVWVRFAGRTGNVQSQLLQEVKSVLLASFSTTNVRGDGQIVSVPFSTYAVEVLPAFATTDGKYRHADANGGGSWRTTDPVAEAAAITASNQATGGKTVHLIKLAKAWKAARGAAIKSFVLELAAVKFLAQWQYNVYDGAYTGFGWYDWMVRDFFAWLQAQKNSLWFTPGTYDVVATGDAWEAQARFAANAASRAVEHHAGERPEAAKGEWRNVFGTYVP